MFLFGLRAKAGSAAVGDFLFPVELLLPTIAAISKSTLWK